jgi:hypothetical protein
MMKVTGTGVADSLRNEVDIFVVPLLHSKTVEMLTDSVACIDKLLHRKGPEAEGQRNAPVLATQASFADTKGDRTKLYNQDLKNGSYQKNTAKEGIVQHSLENIDCTKVELGSTLKKNRQQTYTYIRP